MHTATETLDVLYLTEESADAAGVRERLGFDEGAATVSVATAVGDARPELADGVDCLVCAGDDGEWCLEAVRTVHGEFPAVPVVAFAGDHEAAFVERLLEAGAADVVQSTVGAAPPALVRRRIEGAVDGADGHGYERSLERYETILNTAGEAIYQLDRDGTVIAVNDAAVDLTGYDRTELIGEHVSTFIDEADVREGERLIRDLLDGGEVGTLEMTVRTKAGEAIPCEARIAVFGSEGRMEGSVGVVYDVRERRERERELRERDDLLRFISESVADVVWITTPDKGEIEFVSAAYEDVWGRSRAELYEDPNAFVEAVHPEDREQVREALDRQQVDPDSYNETYRVVRPDGEVRWVRDRSSGVYEDGELQHIVGVARDITEPREHEQKLHEERDLIAGILEASPVGICVYEAGGELVRANERAGEILGLSDGKLTGRSYDDGAWTVRDGNGEPVDPGEFPATRVFETGEPVYDWEGVVERPDGTEVWVSINGAPMTDGDREPARAVVTVQDVTDRKRRERQIAEQRDELARLDRLNAVIRDVDQGLLGAETREEIEETVCDRLTASGEYYFALAHRMTPEGHLAAHAWTAVGEEYVERAFPIEDATPETSPGRRALETGEVQVLQHLSAVAEKEPWQETAVEVGIESLAAIPVAYGDREYGVVAVYAREPEAFTPQEIEVLGELGETVGYAIAAVERVERERTLTALYEATRELLGVTTPEAVSEVVVDVAAEVLDIPGVGVFLFDDAENVLRPASATDRLAGFYDDRMVVSPQQPSVTWETYVSGEQRVYDDVREADLVETETDARSALFLPLGDHGVLVAASAEIGVFDEGRRNLVGLLAATAETALDRVAGRAGIRERDARLESQGRRLDRIERLLGTVRSVDRLLVEAGTREEIERGVCERLAAAEPFAFAWIGSVPPDGDRVGPRTWAGAENGYLDAVEFDLDGAEPAVRAAAEGSPAVVGNVADDLRGPAWAREAIDRNFQAVAAVPLIHGEATYGVLAVYATAPGAFEEPARSVLAEVGRSVAHGINTVETERGILADRLTELELRIDDPDTFLNAVARTAREPVGYREITPEAGGTARVLFALSDPPVADVLDLESEFVAVESLTGVERADEHLFRATLSGDTVARTVLSCGAIPVKVIATGSETHATVTLPPELDARVFVDRIREVYPGTELVARRNVRRTSKTDADLRAVVDEELTERQREVLLTAYESGFFESPRRTSGAELADLLGISQPTVTHHLREAQRRLFAALYDTGDGLDS